MNKNIRFLPRLNLCYLQKKALQNHQMKMQRIKSSLCSTHHAQQSSTNRHFSHERQPRLFLEQSYLNTADRTTPYQRRALKETQMENSRLFKAIKACPSTINHKQLVKHSNKILLEKERIMKFKTEPSSIKAVLKSKLSLEKISAYEQRKWSMTGSRVMAHSPTNNNKQSKLNQLKVKLDKKQQSGKQKSVPFFVKSPKQKQEHFKKAISRNLQRKKENEDHQNPRYSEQKLKGFRQKSQFTRSRMHNPQIHKWKTRCFTSQLQSHQ